jgi:hypothetical protein
VGAGGGRARAGGRVRTGCPHTAVAPSHRQPACCVRSCVGSVLRARARAARFPSRRALTYPPWRQRCAAGVKVRLAKECQDYKKYPWLKPFRGQQVRVRVRACRTRPCAATAWLCWPAALLRGTTRVTLCVASPRHAHSLALSAQGELVAPVGTGWGWLVRFGEVEGTFRTRDVFMLAYDDDDMAPPLPASPAAGREPLSARGEAARQIREAVSGEGAWAVLPLEGTGRVSIGGAETEAGALSARSGALSSRTPRPMSATPRGIIKNKAPAPPAAPPAPLPLPEAAGGKSGAEGRAEGDARAAELAAEEKENAQHNAPAGDAARGDGEWGGVAQSASASASASVSAHAVAPSLHAPAQKQRHKVPALDFSSAGMKGGGGGGSARVRGGGVGGGWGDETKQNAVSSDRYGHGVQHYGGGGGVAVSGGQGAGAGVVNPFEMSASRPPVSLARVMPLT